MKRTVVVSGFALVAVGFLLGEFLRAQTAPPPPPQAQGRDDSSQQQGVEVLGRGPIHEAFAEPTNRAPQAAPVVPKQPPPTIEELPPDQAPAGDNIQWIPGYWAWDDESNDFIWVSGIYRDVPPGRHWVPGYWNQVEGGSQWVAGYWADVNASDTQLLPPPPAPIQAAIPAPPDETSIYLPGCWIFIDNRYKWRDGYWTPHREGWVWSPEAYIWTPAGYVFVDGYWDYELRERGLLFAPVRIAADYWGRRGWWYRPSCVVTENFLLGALFVRDAYRSYYFGDYFDPSYQQRGFVAWTDFHIGRGVIDPLFGYYRAHFHDRPNWARDMQNQYVLRRENPAERPPRTWTERQVATGTVSGHEPGIVPIERLGPSYTLKHLSAQQREEFRGSPSRYHTFSTARGKLETEHLRPAGSRPVAQPRERANSAHEAEPRAPVPERRAPVREAEPKAPVREAEPRAPVPERRPPVRAEPKAPVREAEPRAPVPERRPPVRETAPKSPVREAEPRPSPARPPEPRVTPPVHEAQPRANPTTQAAPRTIRLQSPNVGRPAISTREGGPARTPPVRPVAPKPEVKK